MALAIAESRLDIWSTYDWLVCRFAFWLLIVSSTAALFLTISSFMDERMGLFSAVVLRSLAYSLWAPCNFSSSWFKVGSVISKVEGTTLEVSFLVSR